MSSILFDEFTFSTLILLDYYLVEICGNQGDEKVFSGIISFALFLGVSYGPVEAQTKLVKFKNCKDMNKVQKGGVARSSSTRNKGGKTHYKPYVSKVLYD